MVFVAPASRRLRAIEAAEKGPHSFCHSERSEESLFLFMELNRREIPRFARNDKINYFFRSLYCKQLEHSWQDAGATEDADDQDCMGRGTRAKISHA
jgi:hypothetical protein